MLMVVFGAGASFDSVALHESQWTPSQRASPFRPPLAKDLFGGDEPYTPALLRYPRAAPLVGELQYVASRDEPIEEALEQYIDEAGEGNVLAQTQLMALRYYIHEVIQKCVDSWSRLFGGASNYAVLLNRLERLRGSQSKLLVTFNYDVLLEDAFTRTLGRSVGSTYDYVSNEHRIIKLHGSTSWRRAASTIGLGEHLSEDEIIEKAAFIGLSEEIVPPGSTQGFSNVAEIPAIAVPTITKARFECPPEHVEALIQWLPQIDQMLIIGWKGQEESFLKLCSEHMSPGIGGLVVGGSVEDASNTADHLNATIPAALNASEEAGFSSFLRRGWGAIEDLNRA